MLMRAAAAAFTLLLGASDPIGGHELRAADATKDSQPAIHRIATAEVRANLAACTTFPCPAGYKWYYFEDAGCPEHPDTFEAYVEYWNEDESFAYDVYGGTAAFIGSCYATPNTFGGSTEYSNCTANSPWNCQDLGYTYTPHP
jgi:hypothetical protein